MKRLSQIVCLLLVLLVARGARAERVRDLTDVIGARDNQLIGYGLVTGLSGTGDDVTVPFTQQTVLSLLRRLGIQVDPGALRLRNVAAVLVTATIPAFAKQGSKLDITISSIGNARSLSGGVLVQTVLKGADQHPYAVAQGSILIGGFEAHGQSGSGVRQGATTVARIPGGALVEREIPTTLVDGGVLRFELRTPGFTIASRIKDAINQKLGGEPATADDGGAISVKIPDAYKNRTVELVALLEDVEVVPVRIARVVINERTGTIVAGGDVRLAPSAIVHGALTVVVKEQAQVSQPTAPFGAGTTAVTPNSTVDAKDGDPSVHYVPAQATLNDVAAALSTLGLAPRELASVLQGMRSAGVLEAEVVVQ